MVITTRTGDDVISKINITRERKKITNNN